MADKLESVRGTSNAFKILVVDENGNPYTLASGETLVFGIKDKPYKEDAALIKTVSSGTDGIYTVNLEPDDTQFLKYGKWFYDVGLQSGNEYHSIIEPSTFEILANATKWGDGE